MEGVLEVYHRPYDERRPAMYMGGQPYNCWGRGGNWRYGNKTGTGKR
jgi:hypothetical protein